MCPVKYAGEWRTISWAAERAHSLASGTITSGDFRFVTASLLLFPCVFSLSVFFSFFTFLSFLPLSRCPLSIIAQQRQSNNNPPWQILTSRVHLCAYVDVFVFFKYLCTIWGFILYLCVCAPICRYVARVEAQSQRSSSALSGTV